MASAITSSVQLTDDELLSRFVQRRDELAFEEMVRRHAGIVRSACRRILGNSPDADDAFQTVFWIFARKAGNVRNGQSIGAWLHSVTVRAAHRARLISNQRSMREKPSSHHLEPIDYAEPEFHDWLPLLDAEISRLPERLRLPLVLCELQGVSRGSAAEALRIPEGTLSSRLSRGREILRRRLARNGIVVTGTGLTAAFLLGSNTLSASEPTSITQASLATTSSPQVTTIVQGVLKTMLFEKLKMALIAMLTVAVVSGAIFGGREAIIYADGAKDDAQKLQGKWNITEIRMNGKVPFPEEAKEILKKQVEFKADKIIVKTAATFKLDPSKSPHEIDLNVEEGPEREQGLWKGIYELKDDTLLLNLSLPKSNRPESFESKEGATGLFLKLKKAK